MAASVTNLSILSYPDGFIFYESCQDKSQTYKLEINALVDFPDSFVNFINTKNWISGNQVNVCITEHADRFLILPYEIEDAVQKRSFFDFMHIPVINNILRTDRLSDGKQQFCYEISSERLSCYKRIFTKFKLQSDAFAMTEWTMSTAAGLQKSVILTNIYKKSMYLFAANSSGILFANSFQIQDINEVTYFFLRCIEQTGLDPFETECFICSDSETRDKLKDTLKPYIKNIMSAKLNPQSETLISQIIT